MGPPQEVRSLDEVMGRSASLKRPSSVSLELLSESRSGPLPTALGGMPSAVRSCSHRSEYQRSRDARRIAEGVNTDDIQIEKLLEKEGGTLRHRRRSQKVLDAIGRFCLSGRTERAFRFSFSVPLALLISYDRSLVRSHFSHLAVIVYTIMAALLPPSFSFIALVWFMAIPAVVIGCGAMTLAWFFDSQIYENNWSDAKVNHWTLGTMSIFFLLAAHARIGTLAPLLTIAFYCITYVTQYALIQSSQIIRHGLTVFFSEEWIKTTAANGARTFIEPMPEPLRSIMLALEHSLEKIVALLPIKSIDRYIPIPDAITRLGYKGLDSMVGVPVHFWGSLDKGLSVSVPGGYHLLKTAWKGQHEVGMIWGAVNYALVGVAFFCLSQIMPPIRLMKSALRQGFHKTTVCVRTTMSAWAERTNFAPTQSEPAIRFYPKLEQKDGEEIDRDRQALVFTALHNLQSPMLLSLFEHLLTSPIATNSFLNAPTLMRELRYLAGCVFVSSHFLVSLDKAYGEPVKSIEFLSGLKIDGDRRLLEWMSAVISESLEVMSKLESALALRGSLATDSAAASLMEKVRGELEKAMESLNDRNAESSDIFKQAFDSLSREQDPLDPVPTVKHQQQLVCGLKTWCLLFQTAYIQAPLRVAAEAIDRLDRLERRSFKSAIISVAGFCAGLPLLFVGLFKPFYDAARYLFQKIHPKHDNRPKLTIAYTRWEQIKNLAFYNTHRRIRPSTILHHSASRQVSRPLSISNGTKEGEPSDSTVRLEAGPHMRNRVLRKDGSVSVRLSLPGRGDRHHFFQHGGLWFVLRCTLGSAFLFALQLYSHRWRTLNLLNRRRESPVAIIPNGAVDWENLMSTKYAPWGCLGFLTTIVETPSGTLKRGMLRLTGVLLGTFSAWLLLVIGGPGHGWLHGLWLTCFDFLAVFVSVDPSSPTNGFHPSWGYAAQLFTYQQTVIATQVYLRMDDRDELVLARLVGQAVGIGTAILVSCLLVPTRANRGIRMKVADTLHCLHESFNALAEIIALQQDKDQPNLQLQETWTAYEEGKVRRASAHVKRGRALMVDNELLVELPACLNTEPCLYRVVDGLERLIFFRELFRTFVRQLTEGFIKGPSDEKHVSMLPLISELVAKIELLSRFLQETINHAGRAHWPWQYASRFPVHDSEFVTLVGDLTSEAFVLLERIGALLPETNPVTADGDGADLVLSPPAGKLSSRHYEPIPSRAAIERMTNLSALIWAFGILELTELGWVAAQMRPLLHGYQPPPIRSLTDVD